MLNVDALVTSSCCNCCLNPLRSLVVCVVVLPVCFEVVFEMSRPGERPAAALERAAEDLLGEGAAGPRRQLSLVPVRRQTVCVVT